MEDIDYRGFRLEVRKFGAGWRVFIRRGPLAESMIPNTDDPKGRDAVIAEAKAEVNRLLG